MESTIKNTIEFRVKNPRFPTSRQLAVRRDFRKVNCKHCGAEIETRAITNIECPNCGRAFWLTKKRY